MGEDCPRGPLRPGHLYSVYLLLEPLIIFIIDWSIVFYMLSEPKMMSSDSLFCQKPKDTNFTVMGDKEKHHILAFKKQKQKLFE